MLGSRQNSLVSSACCMATSLLSGNAKTYAARTQLFPLFGEAHYSVLERVVCGAHHQECLKCEVEGKGECSAQPLTTARPLAHASSPEAASSKLTRRVDSHSTQLYESPRSYVLGLKESNQFIASNTLFSFYFWRSRAYHVLSAPANATHDHPCPPKSFRRNANKMPKQIPGTHYELCQCLWCQMVSFHRSHR